MSFYTATEPLTCLHCGNIAITVIHYDDKAFCCEGCRAVYQILRDHDLQDFYTIDTRQESAPAAGKSLREFAFLEDEAVVNKLLNYQSYGLNKVAFNAPSIHCSSCIWLLENMHKIHAGILRAEVNFIKKLIYVDYDPKRMSLKELVYLLSKIGYEPELTLADLHSSAQKQQPDRSLWYKLGIAGFAFGNIMLFSLPSYFGLDAENMEKDFDLLFKVLNLFLSLPVLLYSASEFLGAAYKALRQGHINLEVPLSLGMLALYGTSLYEIGSNTGEGYLDSFTALVFFLLAGRTLQRVFYERLHFSKDNNSYFPLSAIKLEGEQESYVPVITLKVGDTILVRHKELIPGDGILLKGTGLIDYSFVTGESQPLTKTSEEFLYAGGRQMGGAIEIRLEKEPSSSYLTQLWSQHSSEKNKAEDYESLVNERSKYFTYAVLLIACTALAYWTYAEGVSKGLLIMATTLNVSCPCALAVAIPFAYANVVKHLARRGFYLKNPQVIEHITKVDTIVMDKTGTLTEVDQSLISYSGVPLSVFEKSTLKTGLRQSTHPLSVQLYGIVKGKLLEDTSFKENVAEGLCIKTFDPGRGIVTEMKVGSLNFVSEAKSKNEDLETSVYISVNAEVKGRFIFRNKYLEGMDTMIHSFYNDGYRVDVVSGDTGSEYSRLKTVLGPKAELRFNQKPEDKLSYIKSLQAMKHRTMMVGDGLNDSMALRQSDVGVAVLHENTKFSPSSDVIIRSVQLKHLKKYINYCKASMRTIKYGFIFSSIYNIVGLSLAVQGLFSPVLAAILMPISSVSVVLLSVTLTNIQAKKLL